MALIRDKYLNRTTHLHLAFKRVISVRLNLGKQGIVIATMPIASGDCLLVAPPQAVSKHSLGAPKPPDRCPLGSGYAAILPLKKQHGSC